MARRARWRTSKRDDALAHNGYLDMLIKGSPNPRAAQLEQFKRDVPKQRAPRVDHPDLEKHVLSAVGELLEVHPRVLLAVRQNSGGMHYMGADGRPHPVWFYKLVRLPRPMTLTDYWGLLTDGRPFAFECKRPSWREPNSDREYNQEAFIQLVRDVGGVGQFVVDAEEVRRALER